MKLKVTLLAGGQCDDVILTADASATVADVTEVVRSSHPRASIPPGRNPLALTVNAGTPHERVVESGTSIGESGIRSGDSITMTTASPQIRGTQAAVATLNLVAGPGSPASFPLGRGTNLLGRDRSADVRLSDPLVSKRHAKINISDMVEVIDDGSANGILISDQIVDRAILHPGGAATVGDSTFTVTLHSAQAAADTPTATSIAFNRSPRLDPRYVGVELKAPEPPKPPQPQRFPIVSLVAPIMMAGMIYAITKSTTAILFVALSPFMMIGGWAENRTAGKRAFEQGKAHFRSALADLSVQLEYAAELERNGRRREHPSAQEIAQAVTDLSPLTWTRRPEHESFLHFRLGLGTQPSRNSVELPNSNDTAPELWHELMDVVNRFNSVSAVPVPADLRVEGNVGVGGPDVSAAGLFANVVGQMCGTHSPAEVVLAAVAGDSATSWEWMKWLPHTGSEHSPLTCGHLASNSAEGNILVAAIEDLIATRNEDGGDDDFPRLPVLFLCVQDDAPVERARLVQIAERGPAVGVHVVWYATSLERLPAACRVFVEVDPNTGSGRAGFVRDGSAVDDLAPESIDAASIERLARRLAPVVDSGNRQDDQSELPRAVPFLTLSGTELAEQPEAVVDLWRENNALPPVAGAPRRKRDNTLRALVGQSVDGPIHLDLRTHGPHALVGGTTGSGKSEFLQSWVVGMASMHSPSRVTFLFVDYKGGAAFAECVDLPHCVGLVTDLSPHLVRRALTSLNAELRFREHVLNEKRAKDLLELERRNDPDTPPSLVIVVDEFAALVSEVPEFVDGVVNVAQRGRSLGLHLILATQRPAGVIKDNLRANTNLRVALRMADEDDSTDVIGTSLAASFDPALPGRGAVKTGPGRLTPFQSAYVGGHTSDKPAPPSIEICTLHFGAGLAWEQPEEDGPQEVSDEGPNDIHRIVSVVNDANAQVGVPAPRRPWLPELANVYRLEQLPTRRTDDELVFGVIDDPESQRQPEVAFHPDVDGNMAVYGTGGSGKSTFLRSVAIAAAFSPARGGACHVYGLDFGSRGLQMLEPLPHVGSIISGDDTERLTRLLRMLREMAAERAERYQAVGADTIGQYRERSGTTNEPRIVVLVDGVGAFRTAYEGGAMNAHWETFQSLAADGRGVGIHFVVSADRPGAVSSGLASAIQQRLVLRLANEMDYVMLDAPGDAFTETSPPGRAFLSGREVQVAVIGGDPNVARQGTEVERLRQSMIRAGIGEAAPIERLGEMILQSSLPSSVDGLPLLGVWDETLAPVGFQPSGTFLVAGPPQSGRTTTLASMARALRDSEPDTALVYAGNRRSPLLGVVDWVHTATSPSEIETLCGSLTEKLADESAGRHAVFVESVGDFLNTECDLALQDLIRTCRANGHFVVAEGETSSITGSWPLLQAVKVSRVGIVLQPDQVDGDSLFKTSFPRISRASFPPGRGMFVSGGAYKRVQVVLPE